MNMPGIQSLRLTLFLATGMFCGALAHAQSAPVYPAPKNLGDPARLGQGVQRAMTLMGASTPERRNTVRVLFYGQSITEQSWSKAVAEDLKQRFPNANLIIENRALGGFASQRLVNTAETDLYPFYPDLLIFHVYGSHNQYEEIIRRTRERTTAEIVIQTDHVTKDADLTEETDPARSGPNKWNSFMNYNFLPKIAKQYGCGVIDQRNLWKAYLKENNLKAAQLLRDGVHLNDHGCHVMAAIVKAYLARREDVKIDPMQCETVKTLVIGKDVAWKDGKLTLPFEGNRVDVIVKEGTAAPATVTIDGRKPSEHAELYGFTRALPKPGGKWPVITNLRCEGTPQVEEWTLDVKRDPANEKAYTFALRGSKTGPDGEGRSDQDFVSNSRRVAFAAKSWDIDFAMKTLAGVKTIPDAFTVKWKTVPYFVDAFVSPGIKDKTVETVVTLAQGLKNGKHTLELGGSPETPIAAIRVYKPALAEDAKTAGKK